MSAPMGVTQFMAIYKRPFAHYCESNISMLRASYIQAIEKDIIAAMTTGYDGARLLFLGPALHYPERALAYMRTTTLQDRFKDLPNTIIKFLEIVAINCKKTGDENVDLMTAAVVGQASLTLGESERLFGTGIHTLENDEMKGSSRLVFEFLFASAVYSWMDHFMTIAKSF